MLKIGITRQPMLKRLRKMQGDSPVPLTLIAHIKTPRPNEMEKELHTVFAHCWSHGEWFTPDEDVLDYIKMYGTINNLRVHVGNDVVRQELGRREDVVRMQQGAAD
jgi:hypothetical protein